MYMFTYFSEDVNGHGDLHTQASGAADGHAKPIAMLVRACRLTWNGSALA